LKKIEVSNTLRCLDAINNIVLKLKYSPKLLYVLSIEEKILTLFFLKLRKKKNKKLREEKNGSIASPPEYYNIDILWICKS
jgi:hypothetical protein